MANAQAILDLAHFMQSHTDLPFDMAKATAPDKCGTAGCIGGFAAVLWPHVLRTDKDYFMFYQEALADKLGLDEDALNRLCFPSDYDVGWEEGDDCRQVDYCEVTRAGAIATLRRLAETGEVHWVLADQGSAP